MKVLVLMVQAMEQNVAPVAKNSAAFVPARSVALAQSRDQNCVVAVVEQAHFFVEVGPVQYYFAGKHFGAVVSSPAEVVAQAGYVVVQYYVVE